MARSVNLECDWCHINTDVSEEDDPVEVGWLCVERFDIIKDEIVEQDFCSADCLVSYFSE